MSSSQILTIAVEFVALTLIAILIDRRLGDLAAFIGLVVCALLLVWLQWAEIKPLFHKKQPAAVAQVPKQESSPPPPSPAIVPTQKPRPKQQKPELQPKSFSESPEVAEELAKQMVRLSDDISAYAEERRKAEDQLPPQDPSLPVVQGKERAALNPPLAALELYQKETREHFRRLGKERYWDRCSQIVTGLTGSGLLPDSDVSDLKRDCVDDIPQDAATLKRLSGELTTMAQEIENVLRHRDQFSQESLSDELVRLDKDLWFAYNYNKIWEANNPTKEMQDFHQDFDARLIHAIQHAKDTALNGMEWTLDCDPSHIVRPLNIQWCASTLDGVLNSARISR